MRNKLISFLLLGLLGFHFTASAQPALATLAATGITATTATLNGTVNPNGAATTVYFQYGLTTSYGSFSATNSLAAGNTPLSVTNLISSLAPGTTYHFQIAGMNSGGSAAGADLAFTTAIAAPTVTTLAASGLTGTNAVLAGTVNPNGAATTAYFQYGLTTNYDSFSATNNLAATNATLAVSNLVSSLAPGAMYHFRLVAGNSVGSAFGADQIIRVVPHAFTGAEPGQGLDLQGAFVYAVAVGNPAAPGLVGDANFTTDSTPGVGITAVGGTLNTVSAWANLNLGTTTNDIRLAQAMTSIRWASLPGVLTVNLGGLQAGRGYQLQLLFVENSSDRVFDVNVNGTTVVPAFRLLDYGPWGTAIVIPCLFTATGTNALIQLGGGTGGTDNNPTLSAFTLEALSPIVMTLAASGVTATNAIVNGTVNPNGAVTKSYFQYGLTTNYGNFSATNNLAATNAALAVSNLISNLAPATTYHFRLLGGNSAGTNTAADLSLITSNAAPTLVTLAANGTKATNGTLRGTVNPNGAVTTAYFQYGLTTNYGSYSATNTLVATNVSLAVSSLITNLTFATTYHFRLLGGNGLGTNAGGDLTFTTSPIPPVATTLAASGVTATNATLNGTVNPDVAVTKAYFQYGLTTGYGSYSTTNTLVATNVNLSVSTLISNLAPDTTFHFRLVSSNSAGTNAGGDLTFITGVAAPTMTTFAASGVTATNALLNGTVNPDGAVTTACFQYGLTTNYGSYSATNTLVATNVNLSVPTLISGLAPGTAYHFRLIGFNGLGTNAGGDLIFTTFSLQPVTYQLTGAMQLSGGTFQLSFTNLSGLPFTVLGTTNLGVPASNWTVLGVPTEAPPGQYQFTDPQVTNQDIRFYRVRSP